MSVPYCDTSTALYSCSEVSALEALAVKEHKIPSIRLMRRASRAALSLLRSEYPNASRLKIFCGAGNNGGDGWLLAGLARRLGLTVEVVALAKPSSLRGDAALAHKFAHECDVEWVTIADLPRPLEASESTDVLVDAMLGTGLKRNVEGDYRSAIEWLNSTSLPVLALDVPSGLNADSGAVMGDVAVRSHITLSFGGQKRGLLTGAGRAHSARLYYDDLALPEAVREAHPPQCVALSPPPIEPRSPVAHKGWGGHVLVVGGNTGMTGATLLAGSAALRVGAGLVSVATPQTHAHVLSAMQPELMLHTVCAMPDLVPLLARATVVVVGPGLGRDAWSQQMLYAVLGTKLPVVLDADALRLLAEASDTRPDSQYMVLTPHPGEAGALLSSSAADVERDRFAAARTLCEEYKATIVLKGAGTIVCADPAHYALCAKGNAAMASGGMGDVLSGVLGGLLAQEDIYADAADARLARVQLGVYIHSWAADRVAQRLSQRGVLATDLCMELPRLLGELQK